MIQIKRKPHPKRKEIYHLKHRGELIARCVDEESAVFLAKLILTKPLVSDTIPKSKQGAKYNGNT